MDITCAAPRLNAYDFMRCLFALLVKERNVIVDRGKIFERIFSFKTNIEKENHDLLFLFDDIEIRDSLSNVVSNDISDGISNLQTLGVIGKLNPTYEKIIIYLSENEADAIIGSYDPVISDAIKKLAASFNR